MTRHVTLTGIDITKAIRKIRHNLGILTEHEARLAYVHEASDRIDLELRIRDLDRSRRSFSSYSHNTRNL